MGEIKIVEKLTRKHFHIPEDQLCEVILSTETPYERAYVVQHSDYDLVDFRVILKISPMIASDGNHNQKIAYEFDPFRWLLHNGTSPQPHCISSDDIDKSENLLKRDWLITAMGSLYGRGLRFEMDQLSLDVRADLTKGIARCQIELLEPRNRFYGKIGCIARGEEASNPNRGRRMRPRTLKNHFHVSSLTTPRCRRELPSDEHPSFFTISQWLEAQLDPVIAKQDAIIADPGADYIVDEWEYFYMSPEEREKDYVQDCEGRQKEARLTKTQGERLRGKIEAVFPSADVDVVGETALWHPVSESNIRLDKQSKLTSITGWEHAHVAPLWHCYQFPEFLVSQDRDAIPDQHDYTDPLPPTLLEELKGERRYRSVSNEYLYQIHVEQYKKTVLRGVYLWTMEVLHPGFVEKVNKYRVQNELVRMVASYASDGWHEINEWLDRMDKTEPDANAP